MSTCFRRHVVCGNSGREPTGYNNNIVDIVEYYKVVQAPLHLVIFPKEKEGLQQLSDATTMHECLIGHLILVAKVLISILMS